jgi:hypothetical protein
MRQDRLRACDLGAAVARSALETDKKAIKPAPLEPPALCADPLDAVLEKPAML